MVEHLKEIFGNERVENCLTSDNREEFYIAENATTSQSYIVGKEDEADLIIDDCLIVGNVEEKAIHHLAVDACFLTQQHSYKDEKCDFIAFSDTKFCFVELKTNATSEKRVKKNLNKAMSQLGATIEFFDENEVDFSTHLLEAYIVLRTKLYPNDSAGKKARRLAFFDKYEVDLFEESTTEF